MPTLETSIVLGRLWGVALVVVSLGFLINRRRLSYLAGMFAHEGVLILSGILCLIAGLTTILLHNVWTADWHGLVTLFGWGAMLKGLVRIWFPEQLSRWLKSLSGREFWWLTPAFVITLLLGLYLLMATRIVPAVF